MTLFASRLLLENISLVRQEPGSWNEHGEFTPGAEVTTQYRGVSNPARRGTWPSLQEGGIRLEDWREFYFFGPVAPLRADSTLAAADQIEYQGQRYRIADVAMWTGFYVALGVRIQGA